MLNSPPLQSINVLGFDLYIYGVILALAIFIGLLLANYLAKKVYNLTFLLDQSPILILAGVLGARLYFCLINTQFYFLHPLRILNFREGGLSLHGAIISGAVALVFLAKKYNCNLLKLTDCFGVALPLAQSLGRWGNYFNCEAFGKPSESFFKLYIPQEFRPQGFENVFFYHPTFLYESILDALLFVFLFMAIKKNSNYPGIITGLYLILYSIIRIIIEPLRLDCTCFVKNVPIPIIISIILIVIGILIIFYSTKLKKRSSK